MHAKKFMLLLILLAFVITCFITAPVFSGNGDGYPWDADDTGPYDGPVDGKPDTTNTTNQVVVNFNSVGDPNDPDLIDGISSEILFLFLNTIYFYQPDTYFILAETEGSNNEQVAVNNNSAK